MPWKLYGSDKRQQTATESCRRDSESAEIAGSGHKRQHTATDRADFTRERSQVRNPPRPSRKSLLIAGFSNQKANQRPTEWRVAQRPLWAWLRRSQGDDTYSSKRRSSSSSIGRCF